MVYIAIGPEVPKNFKFTNLLDLKQLKLAGA